MWGGVTGKLFELTPARVEELVMGVQPGLTQASDEQVKHKETGQVEVSLVL